MVATDKGTFNNLIEIFEILDIFRLRSAAPKGSLCGAQYDLHMSLPVLKLRQTGLPGKYIGIQAQ